ncbi:MAG: hypothetical protein ACI3XR_07575 [Eubacteriales bacterium]
MGDLLSSLSVRYGQGNVSGEQHRYTFDITALAQKWANGTASPSKGVIFKATDSYESGGTNTYRTFASINRGSNPPILTVEYSSTTASISLNKSSASLYINDTFQLSATTTPGGSVVTDHPAILRLHPSAHPDWSPPIPWNNHHLRFHRQSAVLLQRLRLYLHMDRTPDDLGGTRFQYHHLYL